MRGERQPSLGVESWGSHVKSSSDSGGQSCPPSANPQEAQRGWQPQSHLSQQTPVPGVELDVKLGEGHSAFILEYSSPIPAEHILQHGIQLPPSP